MAGFKLTKAMLDEAAAVLETERDKLKDDPDNGGDWAKGLAKQRLHVNHAELNAIGKAANNDGVLPDGGEQAIEHLLHTITEALFEEVHGHAKAHRDMSGGAGSRGGAFSSWDARDFGTGRGVPTQRAAAGLADSDTD
eukprot:4876067-Prymnesium_polylepis.2